MQHRDILYIADMLHIESELNAGSLPVSSAAPQPANVSLTALRPELQQWLVRWMDIDRVLPVGRGSFGTVYEATWYETQVACKLLRDEGA